MVDLKPAADRLPLGEKKVTLRTRKEVQDKGKKLHLVSAPGLAARRNAGGGVRLQPRKDVAVAGHSASGTMGTNMVATKQPQSSKIALVMKKRSNSPNSGALAEIMGVEKADLAVARDMDHRGSGDKRQGRHRTSHSGSPGKPVRLKTNHETQQKLLQKNQRDQPVKLTSRNLQQYEQLHTGSTVVIPHENRVVVTAQPETTASNPEQTPAPRYAAPKDLGLPEEGFDSIGKTSQAEKEAGTTRRDPVSSGRRGNTSKKQDKEQVEQNATTSGSRDTTTAKVVKHTASSTANKNAETAATFLPLPRERTREEQMQQESKEKYNKEQTVTNNTAVLQDEPEASGSSSDSDSSSSCSDDSDSSSGESSQEPAGPVGVVVQQPAPGAARATVEPEYQIVYGPGGVPHRIPLPAATTAPAVQTNKGAAGGSSNLATSNTNPANGQRSTAAQQGNNHYQSVVASGTTTAKVKDGKNTTQNNKLSSTTTVSNKNGASTMKQQEIPSDRSDSSSDDESDVSEENSPSGRNVKRSSGGVQKRGANAVAPPPQSSYNSGGRAGGTTGPPREPHTNDNQLSNKRQRKRSASEVENNQRAGAGKKLYKHENNKSKGDDVYSSDERVAGGQPGQRGARTKHYDGRAKTSNEDKDEPQATKHRGRGHREKEQREAEKQRDAAKLRGVDPEQRRAGRPAGRREERGEQPKPQKRNDSRAAAGKVVPGPARGREGKKELGKRERSRGDDSDGDNFYGQQIEEPPKRRREERREQSRGVARERTGGQSPLPGYVGPKSSKNKDHLVSRGDKYRAYDSDAEAGGPGPKYSRREDASPEPVPNRRNEVKKLPREHRPARGQSRDGNRDHRAQQDRHAEDPPGKRGNNSRRREGGPPPDTKPSGRHEERREQPHRRGRETSKENSDAARSRGAALAAPAAKNPPRRGRESRGKGEEENDRYRSYEKSSSNQYYGRPVSSSSNNNYTTGDKNHKGNHPVVTRGHEKDPEPHQRKVVGHSRYEAEIRREQRRKEAKRNYVVDDRRERDTHRENPDRRRAERADRKASDSNDDRPAHHKSNAQLVMGGNRVAKTMGSRFYRDREEKEKAEKKTVTLVQNNASRRGKDRSGEREKDRKRPASPARSGDDHREKKKAVLSPAPRAKLTARRDVENRAKQAEREAKEETRSSRRGTPALAPRATPDEDVLSSSDENK
ncbi:unnamed protein product [Amoebophrya sp. A120]|nr:unnamed protein product [Amoebophrya sp. A120]|eukprot:GSA120T00021326001.1